MVRQFADYIATSKLDTVVIVMQQVNDLGNNILDRVVE